MHTRRVPQTESTQQRIMRAASSLFAEKGYAGATTRAIAALAEVNEVTLFRHFGSKENLAKAIMDQFGGPAIAADLEPRFSGDYEQDLTLFGHAMLSVMTERSNEMRMAICEAGHFPEFREIVAENPRQLRLMLARYFEKQMKARAIRKGNPELLAQAFLGMFFSYVVLENFLLDHLEPHLENQEIVEQFVDIFINGTLQTAGS
jgi:AcrR family transcriptional regulator